MSTNQPLTAPAEAAIHSKLDSPSSEIPGAPPTDAVDVDESTRASKKMKVLDGSSRDVFDSMSGDAISHNVDHDDEMKVNRVEASQQPHSATVPASAMSPPKTSPNHSQFNGPTSDKSLPPLSIASPPAPSILEGFSAVDSAMLNATFPSLAPLQDGNVTDPALIRLYIAYHDPKGLQVRLRENWKTLKQLSHAYQQTEAAQKKKVQRAEKSAQAAVRATKRNTSSTSFNSTNKPFDAFPSRLRVRGSASSSSASANKPNSSGKTVGRGQRIFSANPPTRRTIAHVPDPLLSARPSSCPPVLQRDALLRPPTFNALPRWLQKLSAPRWDGTTPRKCNKSSNTACPHISYKAPATTAENSTSNETNPSSLTIQTGSVQPNSSTSDHESHFVAPVTPSKPHLPTKPSSDAPYALPPLPRNLSLISPRTFVSTVVTAKPIDAISPASSIAAALLAAANDAKSTVVPSSAISIPSVSSTRPPPPPRRAGLPQFGDSVLMQSINSTAASSVHCVENASTVVAATMPQIALVRQASSSMKKETMEAAKTESTHATSTVSNDTTLVSTTLSTTTAQKEVFAPSAAVVPTEAEVVADALQDWKSISMNFVDSFLNPPSFSQLRDSSRQPRPILAAALARFAPCTDEALVKREEKDPVHLLNLATGIVKSEGNAVAEIKSEPLSMPMSPPSKTMSLSVSLSQITTDNPTNASNVMLSPSLRSISNHGTFSLISPNITRMSSWLQTHPSRGHSTPHDPNADVPMSPRMIALNESTLITSAATATTSVAVSDNAGNASPATVSGHNTASRVGPEFQCEIPPLFTAEQREWERRAYMHAHAAVHGFPKHLPPPPVAPTTPRESLPIPLVAPVTHCMSSFPASASFALASTRSELRESVTGNRKIARRKAAAAAAMEEAKRKGFDNLSRSAKLATLSFPLPERAPNWLHPSDIYPLTWDEYRERENAAMGFTSSNGFSGGGGGKDTIGAAGSSEREQRKRAREEMPVRPSARSGVNSSRSNSLLRLKFLSTHPSFASYASLFPSDSALARMHFDDDTLSPYFGSAPFVRPPSPTQHVRRQRSISPVHVLSTPDLVATATTAEDGTMIPPPAPTKVDKKRITSLSRFPSSLLETLKFNKRVARLASGEKDAEEVYYDDEEEMRVLENKRQRMDSIVAAQRMVNNKNHTSPHKKPRLSLGVRFEEEETVEKQQQAPPEQPTSPSFPHRNARSIKPAPRHAVRPPATGPLAPSSSPVTPGAPTTGDFVPSLPTRFKKWKTVNGARIVWWVDRHGRVVEGNPPPGENNSTTSNSHSDNDDDSPNNSAFPASSKWQTDISNNHSEDDSMSDGESASESDSGSNESSMDDDGDDGLSPRSSRSSSPVQRIVISRAQLPSNFVLPRSQHRHWRSTAISRTEQWTRPLDDPNAKPKALSLANLAPPARIQAAKTGVAKMLEAIPFLFEEEEDMDELMAPLADEWDEDEPEQ